MDVRQSIHSAHAKTLDTQGLRNEFLVEKVFVADEYTMVYSHIDRIITGAAVPAKETFNINSRVQSFAQNISYREEKWVLSISAEQVQLP